jgi:NACHT domain
MARPRRTWTRIAVWGGALTASVAVLLGLAWLLRSGDLDHNNEIASAVGMLIGLAGLVISAWSLRVTIRQAPHSSATPVDEATRLDRAAEQLAGAVAGQWQDKAGRLALHRPAPLRLTWATTARPVAAPAHTIAAGTLTGRVVRLHLQGHLDEVADKFLALPQRRLVVLGEPGAGKTVLALLLTLELLKRRRPNQPLPVLLGLSSWDPTTEHLHTWLARRLDEDYPALAVPAYGPAAATRLLSTGRILPVLDGLDELPGPLRATAIGELDRAWATRPLVLTCRGREYQHAVAAGGGVLAAAAVVELQPVTAAQATEFLLDAAAPTPQRWDRVAAPLRAHPHGALAAALSIPLMVALARIAYTSPGRDPAELVGLAQTSGQADEVERHLLGAFVPAVYAHQPTPDGRRPRWDADQAERWLRFLAGHLHRLGAHDLAWWQLTWAVPGRVYRWSVGLAIWVWTGLMVKLWPDDGPWVAFGLGSWGSLSGAQEAPRRRAAGFGCAATCDGSSAASGPDSGPGSHTRSASTASTRCLRF